MPKFDKPAEGSWTQHYPQLGTGPVSYEDSISPELFELERRGDLRSDVAQRRSGRAAVPRRELLHQGDRRRPHVDRRGPRRRRRGARLPQHVPSPRQQARVAGLPDGGDRGDLPAVPVQVPRVALLPRRRPAPSCNKRDEFFDLDKADYGLVPVQVDVWEGFIFVNLDADQHASRCATTSASSPTVSRATRSAR